MKKIGSIIFVLTLIFTMTAVSGNVVYNFVKPSYDVYIDDKLIDSNSNLLFNFEGYTYTKNSDLCKQLGINFTWNQDKNEARFYSKDYVTPVPTKTATPTKTPTPTQKPTATLTKTPIPTISIKCKP